MCDVHTSSVFFLAKTLEPAAPNEAETKKKNFKRNTGTTLTTKCIKVDKRQQPKSTALWRRNTIAMSRVIFSVCFFVYFDKTVPFIFHLANTCVFVFVKCAFVCLVCESFVFNLSILLRLEVFWVSLALDSCSILIQLRACGSELRFTDLFDTSLFASMTMAEIHTSSLSIHLLPRRHVKFDLNPCTESELIFLSKSNHLRRRPIAFGSRHFAFMHN